MCRFFFKLATYSNVLVTGGGGFIGSHMAEHYVKLGANVTILDNFSRTEYNLNYFKKNLPQIKIIRADVKNLEEVKEALKNKDLVIHTAGQTAVTTSINDPVTDFYTNSLGTFNICEAARLSKMNPTAIFTSTNKVYGDLELPVLKENKRYKYVDIKGIHEDYPVGPHTSNSPYSNSKINAEHTLRSYTHTYNLPTIRARMSCIYGTRQFGTEDQGWVAWFVIRALQNKPITIYGDGHQVRDVLFVEDLTKAFQLLAENINATKGKAYNLGGGHTNTISLLELLDILKKINGSIPEVSFDNWRLGDQKVYISDITKINKEVGWSPKIGVEEGITKLHSWVRENVNLFK